MCKNCNCPKNELGPWGSICSALWGRDSVEDHTVSLGAAGDGIRRPLSLSMCCPRQGNIRSPLEESPHAQPGADVVLPGGSLELPQRAHPAWTTAIPSFPKSTGKQHLPPQLLNPTWPGSHKFQPGNSKMDLGNLPIIRVCSWQRTRAAVAFSTQAVRGDKDPLGLCMTWGLCPPFLQG